MPVNNMKLKALSAFNLTLGYLGCYDSVIFTETFLLNESV